MVDPLVVGTDQKGEESERLGVAVAVGVVVVADVVVVGDVVDDVVVV